jgi:hypothetical protein
MKSEIRELKVKEYWVHGNDYKETHVPSIDLKGRWFQEAGFNSGQRVTVTMLKPGTIVIEVSA